MESFVFVLGNKLLCWWFYEWQLVQKSKAKKWWGLIVSPLSWVLGWNVNKREVSVDIRDEILIKYYRGTQVVRKLQIEKNAVISR